MASRNSLACLIWCGDRYAIQRQVAHVKTVLVWQQRAAAFQPVIHDITIPTTGTQIWQLQTSTGSTNRHMRTRTPAYETADNSIQSYRTRYQLVNAQVPRTFSLPSHSRPSRQASVATARNTVAHVNSSEWPTVAVISRKMKKGDSA